MGLPSSLYLIPSEPFGITKYESQRCMWGGLPCHYSVSRRLSMIGVCETRYAEKAALRQPTITATMKHNNSVGQLSFRSI